MLHDLIELLILSTPRRDGWTWQRHVFAPFFASIVVLASAYLAFVTMGWWVPWLLALLF